MIVCFAAVDAASASWCAPERNAGWPAPPAETLGAAGDFAGDFEVVVGDATGFEGELEEADLEIAPGLTAAGAGAIFAGEPTESATEAAGVEGAQPIFLSAIYQKDPTRCCSCSRSVGANPLASTATGSATGTALPVAETKLHY